MPARLAATARREAVLLGVLAFGAVFFVYRWWVDLQRPGLTTDPGWWGFTDQFFYLSEAGFIGRLEAIPPDQFNYGPGYPGLAAPFTRLTAGEGWPARDPFMVPNLALWLLAVAATFLVARRMCGRWAGVAAAFGLMLATPLINYVTLPWNTTAVMGAVAVVMIVALVRRPGLWAGVALGAAVGLAYSARYIDVVWVGIAALAVLAARRAWPPRSAAFWGAAGGFAAVMIPTLALHWQTFGSPFTTSYTEDDVIGTKDFAAGNILRHAGESFISAFHLGTEQSTVQPLLATMFLIVLAPVGAAFALRRFRRSGPATILIIGFAAASTLATLVYWSYWFTGSYGLQFGSLHFFKAWFPLWTVAAVVAVIELTRILTPAQRGSDDDGPAPAG